MYVRAGLALAAVTLAAAACGGASGSVAEPAARPATSSSAAPSGSPSAAGGPAAAADARLPEGYDPGRDPKADIAAALTAAKADGHPVLIDFGADWCPDCVVLGKTFRTDTVLPIIGGFHVVAVDVGEFDRHLDVAKSYRLDLRKSGIPALVVLSPDGKVRTATNDGSFSSARSMTADQVATFLKRWQ